MSEFYGSVVEANLYFAQRLHTQDWDISTVADRQAAMVQAAELIDQFDYLEQKYTVQQVLINLGCPSISSLSEDELQQVEDAELAQELEFPRGDSQDIPLEIEYASYLIAKSLLSGRNPDDDLEGMELRTASYGGVRTSYIRNTNSQDHIYHLIPSPEAFTLIKPFFRERDTFDIKRVS